MKCLVILGMTKGTHRNIIVSIHPLVVHTLRSVLHEAVRGRESLFLAE